MSAQAGDDRADAAAPGFTLYGGRGTGAVAVEAALTLLGLPYRLIEADPFGSEAEQRRAAEANPLVQVPVLETPGGERLTGARRC